MEKSSKLKSPEKIRVQKSGRIEWSHGMIETHSNLTHDKLLGSYLETMCKRNGQRPSSAYLKRYNKQTELGVSNRASPYLPYMCEKGIKNEKFTNKTRSCVIEVSSETAGWSFR
ncbi:hypothetical protein M758_3G072600 [Ceratodon purpureus]|nr:hypothetical protein M758_3G072600 [Ceratodon purpureus]